LSLAQLIKPGEAVGLDIDPQIIERARASAAEARADNVRFEVGDVHKLPYPDGAFDAVFAQAMLMHVPDPLLPLKEMRRVLRPGGIIGIADADLAGEYTVPETPLMREAEALALRVRQFMGGSPFYARQQKQLLLQAGFSRPEQTASLMTPEALRRALPLDARFRGYAQRAIEQGWIEEARVEEIVEDMRRWHERPDAFRFFAVLSASGFVDPE
jgi:ubiquinone/menaquinone biosynthesis C-methylase UbiE